MRFSAYANITALVLLTTLTFDLWPW